jgi:hypothetical protein
LKNFIAIIFLIIIDLVNSDRYFTKKGLLFPAYIIVFDKPLVSRVSINIKPIVFFLRKSSLFFVIIINPNIILIDYVWKRQVIDILSLRGLYNQKYSSNIYFGIVLYDYTERKIPERYLNKKLIRYYI